MRKSFAVVLFAVLAIQLVFTQSAEAKRGENLYSILSKESEVKTYVRDVIDSSGSAGKILPYIKKDLDTILEARKSINFVIVKNENDADIIINCDISEFVWMEVDPVDQISNAVSSAYDAMTEENYARLEADFVVEKGLSKEIFKRSKNRRTLWDKSVQATVTKKIMPENESIPLVSERLINVFIRKCLSKKAI